MKKTLLAISGILLLCTTGRLFASGGPDAYGYTWITSVDPGGPTYSWIDISTRPGVQTVTGLADDNSASAMAPIGFNFHYYWTDVNQVRVGSNGWLSFNTSASNIASCFPNIPVAGGAADNYLAVLMSDLNFTGVGNPGQVKYWTNSLDSFIISYINVPYWTVSAPGWAGSTNFQVILCNTDSSITFQYGSLSAFTNGASCNDMEVGIENSTGTVGLQVYNDVLPPSNYVIRFDYPSVVLMSIQDMLPAWNANSENVSEFIFRNVPEILVSDIKNSGNAAVTSVTNLSAVIRNTVPTTVHTAAGSIPTMAAGDDSVYTFAGSWTPTTTGQYSFEVTTSCSQDVNANNNTTVVEYDVVDPCLSSINLSYVTGNAPTSNINWNGGANDDGVAVYYSPPVGPYTINTLQFYITSNAGNGYTAVIYDDDGLNGAPGTILFSSNVPSGSVVSAAWNSVSVSPAVTIPSGGFYVAWFQGGTLIFIGTETTAPLSRRNYEILDGSWASLRYNDVQDVCIRASISNFPSLPIAGFTATNNGPLTTTFNNVSGGLATSWAWDFGDGNTSTVQSPSHTYASGGTYNVCLIASSPCGSDTSCIQVVPCQLPVSGFSNTVAGGTATFTDASTGSPSSWAWDFGDGNTSTQQNPAHTYSANGTYTVCLITNTACGADTICQAVTICIPGTAAFSSSASNGTVSFSDMSTGAPSSWSWDFGDSNTSTAQNPVNTYTASGTYNVCLISDNGCGPDTICQQVTVCIPVVASFSTTDTLGTVNFTDMSTGGASSWAWDFGDGGVSSQQNPVYTYSVPGVYTVCLISTSACAADTVCQQVSVIITGIGSVTNPVFSAFPNPVHEQLTVLLNENAGNAVFVIYDMTGRIVLQQNAGSGLTQLIDTRALPAGIYQLQLQSGGTGIRFVKE